MEANQKQLVQSIHNVVLFEPHKLEVIRVMAVNLEQLQRLDDEENYVIVDPLTMQCYVNGEWINIPEGRFQSDNQLVVTNAG